MGVQNVSFCPYSYFRDHERTKIFRQSTPYRRTNLGEVGEIAIPEIQRPFVWNSSKVRDLMDSLYQGYPVGYIIAWRNPNVKLKDGTVSEGKVLIDGQQRVTALTTDSFGTTGCQ